LSLIVKKKTKISFLIIFLIGLGLRFFYFPNELPLIADAMDNFTYATGINFSGNLPNVLRDSNLPNNKKNVDLLIKWIQNNINKLNHDLPHSGATGLYKLTIKKSQ